MYKWRTEKTIHNEKLRKKTYMFSMKEFVFEEIEKISTEKNEYMGDIVADILIKRLKVKIPENRKEN